MVNIFFASVISDGGVKKVKMNPINCGIAWILGYVVRFYIIFVMT